MSLFTYMEIQRKHKEFLEKAGVEAHVLKYLGEKKILGNKLTELLGDIYPNKDTEYIETLKRGTDDFRITEDGGVWFKTEQGNDEMKRKVEEIRIAGQKMQFSHGEMMTDEDIKKQVTCNYIGYEDGNVVHRTVKVKERDRDGNVEYDGILEEKQFDSNFKPLQSKSANWSFGKTEEIPDRELRTILRDYIDGECSGYGDSIQSEFNYARDPKWQFVMRGKLQGERIQAEAEAAGRRGLSLDEVTRRFNGFVSKLRDLGKTK